MTEVQLYEISKEKFIKKNRDLFIIYCLNLYNLLDIFYAEYFFEIFFE